MRTLKRNPVSAVTRQRARELRKNSTAAEWKLWSAIRNKGMSAKFRRQVPIGPFIVDFYSPDLSLVIEVDGDTHVGEEAVRYDEAREEFLRKQGLQIRRYDNNDVLNNIQAVLSDLYAVIHAPDR